MYAGPGNGMCLILPSLYISSYMLSIFQLQATYRDTHGWVTMYRGLPSYASRVRIHIYYGKIHDYMYVKVE